MILISGVGTSRSKSNSDKFDDNKYCDKSNFMVLICHVTSHNHLFKRSCDLMIGSPLRQVTTLLNLVASGIVVEKNMFNLSRDHVSKRLCNFVG